MRVSRPFHHCLHASTGRERGLSPPYFHCIFSFLSYVPPPNLFCPFSFLFLIFVFVCERQDCAPWCQSLLPLLGILKDGNAHYSLEGCCVKDFCVTNNLTTLDSVFSMHNQYQCTTLKRHRLHPCWSSSNAKYMTFTVESFCSICSSVLKMCSSSFFGI